MVKSTPALFTRAIAVWALLMGAETIHGILRQLFLTPSLGDLRARQVGVFTGSVIIWFITYACIRWIGARSARYLLLIGAMWVILTVTFEFSIGLGVFHYPSERVLADYDLAQGGLMPVGLLFLGVAPIMAAKLNAQQSVRHT